MVPFLCFLREAQRVLTYCNVRHLLKEGPDAMQCQVIQGRTAGCCPPYRSHNMSRATATLQTLVAGALAAQCRSLPLPLLHWGLLLGLCQLLLLP
jgi:hypothetical protein